ncbi:MAG TPA: sulfate ABC transporter ATP-binding protein [Casimicrobiaceae bacterium]
MSIELHGIVKRFGSFVAVDHIDLHIETGELLALLGPSGSGKTSLLRMIAGLEAPDAGSVSFQGKDATDTHARDRQVGFVFQHYALFGHLTIFENVAFGLRVRPRKLRLPEQDIARKVKTLLELVQLDWLADRYPHQLSGGQRQRIALARALAVEPRVLLLDEPFGALDARVRQELRRWLRRLHDEVHVTSVFVTHDQEEALEVADRVVVMNHGRIEQIGAPADVYDHPATPFVFEFLGHVNRLPSGNANGTDAFARAHDIAVGRAPSGSALAARFVHGSAIGPVARMEFALEPSTQTINVELPRERFRELALKPGEIAYLTPTRLHQFAARA